MDLRKRGTQVPEERGFFPKVTTSKAQKDYLYETLMPALIESGELETDSFAEFVRWCIEVASERAGMAPVGIKRLTPGQKRKS